MSDNFGTFSPGLDSPGRRHWQITPGTGVIAPMPRTLYVEAGGTVTIEDQFGTSLTYTVTQGQILPFRPRRITAATATIFAWE